MPCIDDARMLCACLYRFGPERAWVTMLWHCCMEVGFGLPLSGAWYEYPNG